MTATPQDALTFITTVGIPAAILFLGLGFIALKMWPWFVERQERIDKEQSSRHAAYMAEMAANRQVQERVIGTLDKLIETLTANRTAEAAEHDRMMTELHELRTVGRGT